jgi:hypothetical protein
MSDEIVWSDELPKAERKHGRLRVFVEQLRANPGRWGRYPHEYPNGGATSARTSAKRSYPDIEWEKRGDHIWGRFNP